MERAKFEKVVLFLSSVPLFRKQLPRAELPVLATRLTERTWRPGKKLVKQGETGRTFFLIFSGQASVMTQDADGQLVENAVLCEGDWLGGHTLTEERPNVATVVAKGPAKLVTLEMTKRDFEECGLKGKLHFCKRPAMRVNPPQAESAPGHSVLRDGKVVTAAMEEEQELIISAICRNPNLCFLAGGQSEDGGSPRWGPPRQAGASPVDSLQAIRDMAGAAQLRLIPSGTEVARSGELSQEFFVIREGSFEVLVDSSSSRPMEQRSAESAVSSTSLAERIRRKQNFMSQLHRRIATDRPARAWSVMAQDPRDPRRRRGQSKESAERSGRQLTKHGSLKGVRRATSTTALTSQLSNGVDLAQGVRRATSTTALTSQLSNGVDLAQGASVVATLQPGESFGELSLLYNTRREATFRAVQDSEVYVINRKGFKAFTGKCRGTKRFQECCALLDEVDALTPLLRTERKELATNLSDFVKFKPGQRVLTQGKARKSAMWYVVYSGSAMLSQDDPAAPNGRRSLGEIGRGSHFGERSLLAGDGSGPVTMEMNVDAGPCGMTCALFDGEIIRELFLCMSSVDQSALDNIMCEHVEDQIPTLFSRMCSRRLTISSIKDLEEVCLLGRGGFGEVFLTRCPQMEFYAVKRISKGHAVREEITQQLRWERDLMSMLASPFVIKLFGTFKDEQFVYLVQEAALGGDLYQVFHMHAEAFIADKPRGASTKFYTACIVLGLEHLHERRIVYRDVKPENVLLDRRGYGKICDMGLARFVVGKTNTQVGTPDYMAPEMIEPPHFHDFAADWWALGVLAFELLNRQTPFDDDGLDDMQERLLAIRRSQELDNLKFVYDCPMLARSFIQRLLTKLPHRLGADGGAATVRDHTWFKKFDFEALRARRLATPIELSWEEPTGASTCRLHSVPQDGDHLFVSYDPSNPVMDENGVEWDADFDAP